MALSRGGRGIDESNSGWNAGSTRRPRRAQHYSAAAESLEARRYLSAAMMSSSLTSDPVVSSADPQEFGLQQGKLKKLTISENDGDLVTFSLNGGGSGTLQTDNRLTLTNTTAHSVLSIRVTRNGGARWYWYGSGSYELSGISSDGLLKRISAPHVNVTGPIELNTAGVAVGTCTTTIRLGVVGTFSANTYLSLNTHGVPIHSLTLVDWQVHSGNDVVIAPWIGSIVVLGDGHTLDFGCWMADVVTTSSNHGVAIGSIKVADSFYNANIWASGSIGHISADHALWGTRIAAVDGIGSISTALMLYSDVLVGVEQEFEGRFVTTVGDFANRTASLKKLTVRGYTVQRTEADVSDSHVSAPAVGTASLADIQANPAPILHVLRDTGTLTVKRLKPNMLSPGTWNAGQPHRLGHERPNLVEVLTG